MMTRHTKLTSIATSLHREDARLVQVGARRIHLTERGEGYPVLMLHGGGPGASGVSNYERNIDALAARFRVLVPDLPGYGRSTKGIDRDDPFGDLAGSMLGLLDALELESAHVIGNSYGGACAVRMALDAPRRIASLVLMAPGGVNTTRELPTKGLRLLLAYYGRGGPTREKVAEFLRGYLVQDASLVPDALVDARFQASIDPQVVAMPPLQRPKGLGAALRMDLTRDARLRECETPTLAIWGTEDRVNRPSGGRALQRRMRNCDLYLVSNTGHWVQWERADEFNALTTAFLAKHTPASGAGKAP
jgi:4,5:9,10-diseco-3-hydroxy-5,9,17-trioxoandrosta-1(10),2-diene-4-oate hydrolase